MFNKRLQHDFEIPNAGLHRVYLLEESDTVVTWPVIKGQGEPVRLSFGNRNNSIYTPILPGTLTWRIVIQNQAARDAIDAVFESIEGDYRVEFYQVEGGVTENLIWRGDLLLDQYNEDLRGFPGFVELIANDLASLQGKNYLHTDGFVHTGRESQLQIIKNCVQLLGYDLGFACSDAIYEDTMDGDPLTDDPMLQAYADNAWYYPVDQFLQTRLMSAWDVLSSILISKACRIRQWGGRWHVEQIVPGVHPEPLPTSDGKFALSTSGAATVKLWDGATTITDVWSSSTGITGVGDAVYIEEDGSVVIVTSRTEGAFIKYDAEGNQLWKTVVSTGTAIGNWAYIKRSLLGSYISVNGNTSGTYNYSCIDAEGNILWQKTVSQPIHAIGFDLEENAYFHIGELPSTSTPSGSMFRIDPDGAVSIIDISGGSTALRVYTTVMNRDRQMWTARESTGFVLRDTGGAVLGTFGTSFAADISNILPRCLAVDSEGNLIYRLSDSSIKKINPFSDSLLWTASWALNTSDGRRSRVQGIETDTFNNVWVKVGLGADNRGVRIYDSDGTLLHEQTVGGDQMSVHPGSTGDIYPPAEPPDFFSVTATYGLEVIDIDFTIQAGSGYIGSDVYVDGVKDNVSSITDPTYQITGLTFGTYYLVRVALNFDAGQYNRFFYMSVYSSADPTALLGYPANTSVALEYPSVFDADGYNIYLGAVKQNDTPTTELRYLADGLTIDTDNTFTVKSVDGGVETDIGTITRRTRDILQPVKRSLLFTKSDGQYLSVPHTGVTGTVIANCSFECWVRSASTEIICVMGSYNSGGSASGLVLIRLNTNSSGAYEKGRMSFQILTGTGINRTAYNNLNTGVTDDNWHHIAARVTAGVMSIVLDGVNVTEAVSGSGSITTIGLNQDIFIGAANHPDGFDFLNYDGKIADFKIYTIARPLEAINNERLKIIRGDDPGLQRYYPMIEASGSTVRDVTKYAEHGTLDAGTGTIAGMWNEDIPPFT